MGAGWSCGGVGWSLVELGGAWWSWVELDGAVWSLMELDGAVWSLVELDGEYSALLQARKLSKYYKLALPTLVRGDIDSLASLSEYLRAK